MYPYDCIPVFIGIDKILLNILSFTPKRCHFIFSCAVTKYSE